MSRLTNSIKHQLQHLFNLFGYELRKYAPPLDIIPIDVLPLVIQDYLLRKPEADFFILQIGAHDGIHYDPIYKWIKKYHWQGVLIEPQPKIFKRLIENYAGEPQLAFENAAIYAQDGYATLYTFKENPGLPDHASMLASFSRETVAHNGHGYRGEIEELKVPALSIPTLLAKHKVRHIDLLQIDTEGYDYEILKMFDLNQLRPSIIHFESAFLDRPAYVECCKRLNSAGYHILTVSIDTIAYLQTEDKEFAEKFKNAGYDL